LLEELNEKQKEEIEQQLTLENRIRNGEVVEGRGDGDPEIITIADDPSPEIDAIQSPLPPHPPRYSGSPFATPPTPFRANPLYQQPVFIPSATTSTGWKPPPPQTVSRSLNSTEQPYRENNHAYRQSTSDFSPIRQYRSNTSSNIPYTFQGQNNNATPNSTAYYREDTSMDSATRFRQQVQKFKQQIQDYGNKFSGGTSSGNPPNNSSLQ
jgi:hypothetical protein